MSRLRFATALAAGALVAVTGSTARPIPDYGLYEAPTNGTAKLVFARQNTSVLDLSPDRTRLVFSNGSQSAGYNTLWVARLNGSRKHVLTNRFDGGYARWSPNGQLIAYTRSSRCGRVTCPQVWVVRRTASRGARFSAARRDHTSADDGQRTDLIPRRQDAREA